MEGARLRLSSSTDKLVWEYNRSEGSVTAELVYDSIIFSSSSLIGFPLQALILSGILPKKIRCSVWLALANKIRTWGNLQKRGWIGPGCCALCGNGEDCVQHLFSSRFMRKNAIIYLSDVYHFLPPQHSDKLSTFLSTWISLFLSTLSVVTYPFLLSGLSGRKGTTPSSKGIIHLLWVLPNK